MIYKRVAARLKAQDWVAILIEIGIVVIGVFIGILAANWKEERQAHNETKVLLSQLRVEMVAYAELLDQMGAYYATTGRFAKTAADGWARDPRVTDNDFVVAAYQASQVTAAGNKGAVWAEIFGADDLRNVGDPQIRSMLAGIMTFDNSLVNLSAVATPYRERVRKVIPDILQATIRSQCGDQLVPGPIPSFQLPPRCNVRLPQAETRAAVDALRAHPELASELRWHQAAVANQLLNAQALRRLMLDLNGRLARLEGIDPRLPPPQVKRQ